MAAAQPRENREGVRIAQDAAADELLGRDPLALLIGMLLDPHMRREDVARRSDSSGSA